LDIKNKTEVIQLLRTLSTTAGKTILLSTHDLDLALRYADKLWLFNEKEIIPGLPEDLVINGNIVKTFGYYDTNDFPLPTTSKTDIYLTGTGFVYDLTVKALSKAGIRLNEQSEKRYTVQLTDEQSTWIHEASSASFESIEALISHITQS